MTEADPPAAAAAPWHRSRWLWAVGAAALLVGIYAFVGYRVLPGVVRSQAIDYVRATYGRELQMGAVAIDPFRLQLDARDVAFPDADGTRMLALRRLFVDFEVSSLWRRAYVFRELAIEGPYAHAVVRPDGAMNLADLSPPPAPGEAPPPDEPLPSVIVEQLVVSEGSADYDDLARRTPFHRHFPRFAFSLQDFRTTPEGGEFRLSARSQADEQFEWRGRFALAPAISSEGQFTIGALHAPGVAEFLGDALPFGLTSGTIDLAGRYRVALGKSTEVDLRLPSIRLANLALRAQGVDADWVKIPSIAVDDVAVSMPAQTVRIARVAVQGLHADAWMDADGSVNVRRLFAPAAAAADADGAPAPSAAATPAAAPAARPWQLGVASVEIDDASIHFEDRMKAPAKTFEVAPVRVRVRDASLDLSKPLPVELSATVNEHAPVAVSGTVTPEPLAASLDVTVADARLTILQPYVLPYADLTVRDGTVAVKGRLDLRPPGSKPSELSFAGDVTVRNFRSTDNALDEEFVSFGSVQVQKLRYEMAPDALTIDRISVRDPYARVAISREAILNVSAVMDPAGTAAALKARREADAARARETPQQRKQREQLEKAAAAAKEKQRKADARKGKPAPAPARAAAAAPETMPIRIREVRIDGGRLNFSDYSVQPNFSAEIRQLRGSFAGLSSAPTSRAKLALDGNVGEFSPVRIAGELQPFMYDRYTNVQLSFANISLPVFNPYSGKFAGYSIAKGKLDTDLSYLIQDRKLDAKHHVRIDQLEWGEATAERGEATLPVKFATVLLRDKDGVIDLNLPVSGTLDDPKFRVGPIVWQIVKNLIVKAVTAPFALLGALFGGSEEAQFVDFAPGRAELDPAQLERLGSLSKALVAKPGLQLDVPLGGAVDLDGPALQELRYQRLLADATRRALKLGADAPVPAFEGLEPKQKLDVLRDLVKKQAGALPEIPEPPAPPEGTSRAEAKALRQAAELDVLAKTARAAVTLADGEIDALGQQRAEAVQRALLGGGQLEPSRVYLVKNDKVTSKDGKVRYELGLK